MRYYALRYLPLLLLALLLIPVRSYFNDRQQYNASGIDAQQTSTSPIFSVGPTLYGVAMPSAKEGWTVGGTFQALPGKLHSAQQIIPAQGRIIHYLNGSWIAGIITPKPLLSISMSSSTDGWAVGYAGQMAHYNGHMWQILNAPTQAVLLSVSMSSADDGWAVGLGGIILHFHDQHWTVVTSPTREDLHSVSMISSRDGWITGEHGTLLHFSQGRWQTTSSPTSSTLNSITLLSSGEGWAVGEHGSILHYSDGSWDPVNWIGPAHAIANHSDLNLLSINIKSKQVGWIVGDGFMLNYNQEVWEETDALPYVSAHALVMNTPEEGWAVGDYDSIYHYYAGSWKVYTPY